MEKTKFDVVSFRLVDPATGRECGVVVDVYQPGLFQDLGSLNDHRRAWRERKLREKAR